LWLPAPAAATVRAIEHIGIVACSPEGAALCYRTIAIAGLELVGPHDHPRVTMDSIPMARWMPAFDDGDLDALAAIMLDSAHVVATAGADFAICPDNSAHICWEPLQAATPLPWLHIADAVTARAEAIGARRVGILGTRFTMGGSVYPQAFGAAGIECVVPDAADVEVVDRIIFDELVNGVVTTASRRIYQDVIDRLADRGCDAVALVCTEIPLLIGPDDAALPTLDSTRLLARVAVERAVGP
jgi:aspartate racemase